MGTDAESLALAVSGSFVDFQLERGVLMANMAAERLSQARKANDQTIASTGKVGHSHVLKHAPCQYGQSDQSSEDFELRKKRKEPWIPTW